MSTKREEERNEKIIRGLMKLPPNRRCINCNSMGPQYVCTNFWTFICTTCSGIHREFTHRVKSVSMAKFTSQEVDALQKGGNQRARELYLKGWDLQRQRLPDNSNVDKVREFIKHVYMDKKYAVEKSSDKPPRDPQSLRSHDDETRRASSYHSYSQSPPYDFQYEERRYGKNAPVLTRKPGSDRGLYEGKLSSFSSPSRFSDHANDEGFANEASYPRASNYSASSGGDPFRSDVNSQRETGSPFSETSRDISSEVQWQPKALHSPDSNSRVDGERTLHRQRTASSGSFGSFDGNSMSFKSVNSLSSVEIASEPGQSNGLSLDKPTSFPSRLQPSVSGNFDGLDLFSTSSAPQYVTPPPQDGCNSAGLSLDKSLSLPSRLQSSVSSNFDGLDLFASVAPQNVTSPPHYGSNSQLSDSTLSHSVDLFQKPISSVQSLTNQHQSEVPNPSPLDLFATLPLQQSSVPSYGKTSDMPMPENGGWATFDIPQNLAPNVAENSAPAAVPSSDGNFRGSVNPFSLDQSSSQDSAVHEPSAERHTVWLEDIQNVEAATNNAHLWSAFEDSAGNQPFQNMLKDSKQVAVRSAPDAQRLLGFGVYEDFHDDGNVQVPVVSEPSSCLSSHFSMALHGFSTLPSAVGVHSGAMDHKPINPFDLPNDSDMESRNMSPYWEMSSLQAALPSIQTPDSYVGSVNHSWFPQNSIAPGGIPFDHPSASLGFIAGQAPAAQISMQNFKILRPHHRTITTLDKECCNNCLFLRLKMNVGIEIIPAQDHVASVGGNPFA